MNIFPSSWLEKPTSAKATVAKKERQEFALGEIKKALNKYPPELITKEVKKIYVAGTLSWGGASFTGTNSRENLYISVNKNDDIEKTFHHELSSILLRNNSTFFDEIKWQNISPLLHNTSSTRAVKNGYSGIKFKPELLQKGFLCDYALSNWENDFNMYAENIFDGGKEFWKLVDSYPLVKEKTLMAIDFYTKINPVFSQDFFRFLADI